MNYAKQAFQLVRSECKRHKEANIPEYLMEVRIREIDQFLVDGRRQIRTWRKEAERSVHHKKVIEGKVTMWLGNEELAINKDRDDLIEKARSVLKEYKSELEKIKLECEAYEEFISLFSKDLEDLENVAQIKRDQLQQSQSQSSSDRQSTDAFDPSDLMKDL
ncbi:MAG: hypothetical protein HQL32_00530 [Planctomycetes bacterium]|nr:hypothetical protein [Planctomycetota bacterium]